MNLLLDTQILIWLMTERRQLNRLEKDAIAGENSLSVSTLSLMELRMKRRAEHRRGLPPTVVSPANAIAFCETRRIALHPFIPEDATVLLEIDPPHGDPFDEMLLAHAQALQAKLLTRDKKLRRHPLAYRG